MAYWDWDCWGYTLKREEEEEEAELRSVVGKVSRHVRCVRLLPVAGGDVGGLRPAVELGAGLVAGGSSLVGALGLWRALALLQHGALTLPHPGGQQGALRGGGPAREA